MSKVEQIRAAIHDANLFRSKLEPEVLGVAGFTSLKIRHLMNNLGAISTNYFEIGSHKGSTLCSAVYKNHLTHATACDNFSEFNEGNPMHELLNNTGKFKPGETQFKLITKDCWEINKLPEGIDLYLYDGTHDYDSQRRAVTQFLPFMADEFIFCVDDFDLKDVHTGTYNALAHASLNDQSIELIDDWPLQSTPEIPNESWHQGFYVALIRKK